MTSLRYDGSPSGFLCLLGTAIKQHLAVNEIRRGKQPATGDLFAEELLIECDRVWAARVAAGLERKLGKRFLTQLGQALLSEEDGIEWDLLELTRRALKQGPDLLDQLADPLVNRVDRAALRTSRERHRLLGLLRFERLIDDIYLARIIPKTNVVPLLGNHFAKRLGDQRWLIVDDKRRIGVWGENRRWELTEQVELSSDLRRHEKETQIADLWRRFYHSIGNPDRHNPKLRQQFMPKRYWAYLTELGDSEGSG